VTTALVAVLARGPDGPDLGRLLAAGPLATAARATAGGAASTTHLGLGAVAVAGRADLAASADGRHRCAAVGPVAGGARGVLRAFLASGRAGLARLPGGFVFAVLDRDEGTLTVGRDALGNQPGYYAETPAGAACSSSLTALARLPWIDRAVSRDGLLRYLAGGFVPAPHTIYSQVRALLPGEIVRLGPVVVRASRRGDGPDGPTGEGCAMGAITDQVFIGGCSRSGTTLLGAMLGAHPEAVCTPESHFKASVLREHLHATEGVDVAEAYRLIRRHWRFQVWRLAPAPLPEEVTSYAGLLSWLVARYGAAHGRPAARLWVDHTPENTTYAAVLRRVFPRARFLHLVRDGKAVAASIMPLDWGPNSVVRAAHWWIERVSYGLAAEGLLGPEVMLRVSYERLVTAPAETLREICGFLGLGYDPRMAAGRGFDVPPFTAPQHRLVGQPPDPGRTRAWEREFSRRQVEMFEYVTRDYLEYLGYPLRYGLAARRTSVVERVGQGLTHAGRGLLWNPVRWLRRARAWSPSALSRIAWVLLAAAAGAPGAAATGGAGGAAPRSSAISWRALVTHPSRREGRQDRRAAGGSGSLGARRHPRRVEGRWVGAHARPCSDRRRLHRAGADARATRQRQGARPVPRGPRDARAAQAARL
jgi:hypothetical protein